MINWTTDTTNAYTLFDNYLLSSTQRTSSTCDFLLRCTCILDTNIHKTESKSNYDDCILNHDMLHDTIVRIRCDDIIYTLGSINIFVKLML